MFGRIAAEILNLKGYMAAVVCSGLLLALLYSMSLRFFRWKGFLIKIHGYFMKLDKRSQLRTAFLYLREVMIFWCVITLNMNSPAYFIMLVVFGIISGILSGKPAKLLLELGNTALFILGIYTGGILISYMKEIQFEWNILFIYILLGAFVIMYSLYFFLKDIKNISEERTIKRGKEKL
ncbi:MAG: hypothetical protein Q4B86_04825 [Eubacteriales bacterium]|nr:hypothetical protein [Eubacteriales bacterium]